MESLNDFLNSKAFPDFYKKKLQPTLQAIDRYYQKSNTRQIDSSLIYTVGMIFSGVILFTVIEESLPFVIMIMVFGFGYFVFFGRFTKEVDDVVTNPRSLFKYKIIYPCLQESYSRFVYKANQRMGTATVNRSMLSSIPILYIDGEDFFRFYIGEIMLQFSEIKTNSFQNFTGTTHLFLSVDFHKHFKTSCIVKQEPIMRSQKMPKKYRAYIGEDESLLKLDLVKLETSQFEDEFVVYGEDQVETRFILTPSFMEKMVRLQKKLRKRIEFSFVNNRMYLIVYDMFDLFEPEESLANDNVQLLKNKLSVIGDMTDVISDLQLDAKLWKL